MRLLRAMRMVIGLAQIKLIARLWHLSKANKDFICKSAEKKRLSTKSEGTVKRCKKNPAKLYDDSLVWTEPKTLLMDRLKNQNISWLQISWDTYYTWIKTSHVCRIHEITRVTFCPFVFCLLSFFPFVLLSFCPLSFCLFVFLSFCLFVFFLFYPFVFKCWCFYILRPYQKTSEQFSVIYFSSTLHVSALALFTCDIQLSQNIQKEK